MSSFTVQTPALAAAALVISQGASSAQDAHTAVETATCTDGFGGEPIETAFRSMCQRALGATETMHSTLEGFAGNVAAAGVGYLVTDRGVVPAKALDFYSGQHA